MNRYFMIRRLTGPLVLLLLGVVALLHQMHLVHWGIFVPLLLILLGVMKLAERASFEADGPWQQPAGQTPSEQAPPREQDPLTGAAPAASTSGAVHEDQGGRL